jgi:hypothetical protein
MVQEVRHLPLYVRGSEGLDVCHFCEMVLVEAIREMINIANRSRLVVHKRIHEVAKEDKKL